MIACPANSTAADHPAARTALPCLPLVCAHVAPTALDVLRQAGVPLQVVDMQRDEQATIAGRFVLYDSRRGAAPSLQQGQSLVDLAQLSVSLPVSFGADNPRTARRVWTVGNLELIETVAEIDRRSISRAWLSALRRVIQARGGVWLTVAHVPAPYRTLFNLRADHDTCLPDDYRAFLELISGHEDCVSHFLCMSGFVEQPELLARLQGHDVGSHGYVHHTYRDPRVNRRNMARGIEALRTAGFNPSGYVAPHGRYPAGMTAALNELSISHSGEFALGYDDWPYRLANSTALQIPVHPVCLGLAFEALQRSGQLDEPHKQQVADLIGEYFSTWAREQHAACEPIVLYGHPDERLGRYPQVLRQLFRTIDALPRVWRATQTEIARWWRARERITLGVQENAAGYRIMAENLPPHDRVAVEVWHGDSAARVELTGTTTCVACEELHFEQRHEPRPASTRDEATSWQWRAGVKEWLDWEYATPTDEIDTTTVRGWLKRRLRRHFARARNV